MIVREFAHAEFETYLAIRRESLATSPEAFGDTVLKFDDRSPDIKRERFDRHVLQPDNMILGAFEDEQCVGLTGALRNTESGFQNRLTLWGVFVRNEFRGRGISSEMIRFATEKARTFDWLEEITLSVKKGNLAATRSYESCGFVQYQPDSSDPVVSSACANGIQMKWRLAPQ